MPIPKQSCSISGKAGAAAADSSSSSEDEGMEEDDEEEEEEPLFMEDVEAVSKKARQDDELKTEHVQVRV